MSGIDSCKERCKISTHKNGSIVHLIEPGGPPNWKINRSSNTNYANISNNLRRSNRLILSGHGQQITNVSRWGGITQFGNSYLGKPLNLNYLGKMEGQLGGSGSPPINKFN
jgi:hypothetical protein